MYKLNIKLSNKLAGLDNIDRALAYDFMIIYFDYFLDKFEEIYELYRSFTFPRFSYTKLPKIATDEDLSKGLCIEFSASRGIIQKVFNQFHAGFKVFPDPKGIREYIVEPGCIISYWVTDKEDKILNLQYNETDERYLICTKTS